MEEKLKRSKAEFLSGLL